MAEAILADTLTKRIVDQLSPAHLRVLKRKTQSIREFRRNRPYGAAPQNSVFLMRGTHGIPQVRDIEMRWSCQKDGSQMKLRASIDLGRESSKNPDLRVYGQQCKIIADVPDTLLAGIRKTSIGTLVETKLLEGYAIHRIVNQVAYLKVPDGEYDISEVIEHAPANDNMTKRHFLLWLLENDITKIERTTYKMLSQTSEYDAIAQRLKGLLGDEDWEGKKVPITDLMTRLRKDADLALKLAQRDDLPRQLSLSYRSERLHYDGSMLRWFGSMRRDWYNHEGYAFSHICRRPGMTHARSRMRAVDIEEALSKMNTDKEHLL